MKGKNLLIAVFFCLFTTLSCKENKQKTDAETREHVKVERMASNQFVPFTAKGDNFTYKNYELSFNDSDGNFMLIKNGKNLGEITIGKIGYNGPGYTAYISQQNNIDNIIIEATADIGTAWYYSVVIEQNTLTNQFLIEEPRSNSDKFSLDKFVALSVIKDSLQYRFEKKLIAKYSVIPKELKSDQKYYYLTKPIKDKKYSEQSPVDQYISETGKNFQLVSNQSFDINSDGIADKFLVMKTKEDFNSEIENSKKSQIAVFVSENNSFRKYVNNTTFPNDSNDQFDEISFGKNTFTVKIFNEIPGQYFIEKHITFKYEKQNIILNEYSISKGNDRKILNISKIKPVNFQSFDANDSVYK